MLWAKALTVVVFKCFLTISNDRQSWAKSNRKKKREDGGGGVEVWVAE